MSPLAAQQPTPWHHLDPPAPLLTLLRPAQQAKRSAGQGCAKAGGSTLDVCCPGCRAARRHLAWQLLRAKDCNWPPADPADQSTPPPPPADRGTHRQSAKQRLDAAKDPIHLSLELGKVLVILRGEGQGRLSWGSLHLVHREMLPRDGWASCMHRLHALAPLHKTRKSQRTWCSPSYGSSRPSSAWAARSRDLASAAPGPAMGLMTG